VVELLECEGMDVIWMVVDRLSKMPYFVPDCTTIDAFRLADFFVKEIIHLHGLPQTIVSD